MTELRFRINQTKVVMAAQEYKKIWKDVYDDASGKYPDTFGAHETIRQSREKLFKALGRLNGEQRTECHVSKMRA